MKDGISETRIEQIRPLCIHLAVWPRQFVRAFELVVNCKRRPLRGGLRQAVDPRCNNKYLYISGSNRTVPGCGKTTQAWVLALCCSICGYYITLKIIMS